MVSFIGHGLLEIYSCKINLTNKEKLGNLLEILEIPENLKDNIIFIKNHNILDKEDFIENEDEIHFHILPFGG